MLLLAGILSIAIGISLGLLGGGGSILTLPVLVYVLGVDAKQAIPSALFVVGTTSLMGVVAHARAGRVRWSVGALFGGTGMLGAYGGGRLAHLLPSWLLLGGFGALMLVTSLAMLRPRRQEAPTKKAGAPALVALVGVGVGALSGLLGAGGGFLIVPALTLLAGLTMPEAIGTSLLVIAAQSFAGLAGHLSHTHLDPLLISIVAGGAIGGSLVGARLSSKLSAATLRRTFAWFVLAMALFLLGKQLPPGALLPASVAVATIAAVLVARRVLTGLQRRSTAGATLSTPKTR
jgi:uncharacterized protein